MVTFFFLQTRNDDGDAPMMTSEHDSSNSRTENVDTLDDAKPVPLKFTSEVNVSSKNFFINSIKCRRVLVASTGRVLGYFALENASFPEVMNFHQEVTKICTKFFQHSSELKNSCNYQKFFFALVW